MADKNKQSSNQNSASNQGGSKESGGSRRKRRSRGKSRKRRFRQKKRSQEANAEKSRSSNKQKGKQQSGGDGSSRSSRRRRNARARRRRRERRRADAQAVENSIIEEIDKEYVPPESVFIYTHTMRPSLSSPYEFRSESLPLPTRQVEDFGIDLSGIVGSLLDSEIPAGMEFEWHWGVDAPDGDESTDAQAEERPAQDREQASSG
jgi:hypothetical protein